MGRNTLVLPASALPRTLVPLLVRAGVLYVLLRALLAGVSLVATGETGGSPDSPLGTVIATIVGLVDIRRRGEFVLWYNLGVGRWQIAMLYMSIAALGESLVVALSR